MSQVLRQLFKKIQAMEGCVVLESPKGLSALEVCHTYSDKIHLLKAGTAFIAKPCPRELLPEKVRGWLG